MCFAIGFKFNSRAYFKAALQPFWARGIWGILTWRAISGFIARPGSLRLLVVLDL
jgi:hypothetical protein